jgi:hypothetical protein
VNLRTDEGRPQQRLGKSRADKQELNFISLFIICASVGRRNTISCLRQAERRYVPFLLFRVPKIISDANVLEKYIKQSEKAVLKFNPL